MMMAPAIVAAPHTAAIIGPDRNAVVTIVMIPTATQM
jgi:hypothetical protein